MKGASLVSYLANLIMITSADGVIDNKEEIAIDRICNEISAKRTDVEKARKGKGVKS